LIITYFIFLKVHLYIILLLGVISRFYSGIFSIFEKDFKKIVALSTLNQLSFIFVSLRIQFKEISFFHLCTHAFFKSLLFICVGVILHFIFNVQDNRVYRRLLITKAFVVFVFILTVINLTGIVFTSGFFSKDIVIEKIIFSVRRLLVISIFIFSIFFTFLYRIRLINFLLKRLYNNKLRYFRFSKIEQNVLFLGRLEASVFSFVFLKLF